MKKYIIVTLAGVVIITIAIAIISFLLVRGWRKRNPKYILLLTAMENGEHEKYLKQYHGSDLVLKDIINKNIKDENGRRILTRTFRIMVWGIIKALWE